MKRAQKIPFLFFVLIISLIESRFLIASQTATTTTTTAPTKKQFYGVDVADFGQNTLSVGITWKQVMPLLQQTYFKTLPAQLQQVKTPCFGMQYVYPDLGDPALASVVDAAIQAGIIAGSYTKNDQTHFMFANALVQDIYLGRLAIALSAFVPDRNNVPGAFTYVFDKNGNITDISGANSNAATYGYPDLFMKFNKFQGTDYNTIVDRKGNLIKLSDQRANKLSTNNYTTGNKTYLDIFAPKNMDAFEYTHFNTVYPLITDFAQKSRYFRMALQEGVGDLNRCAGVIIIDTLASDQIRSLGQVIGVNTDKTDIYTCVNKFASPDGKSSVYFVPYKDDVDKWKSKYGRMISFEFAYDDPDYNDQMAQYDPSSGNPQPSRYLSYKFTISMSQSRRSLHNVELREARHGGMFSFIINIADVRKFLKANPHAPWAFVVTISPQTTQTTGLTNETVSSLSGQITAQLGITGIILLSPDDFGVSFSRFQAASGMPQGFVYGKYGADNSNWYEHSTDTPDSQEDQTAAITPISRDFENVWDFMNWSYQLTGPLFEVSGLPARITSLPYIKNAQKDLLFKGRLIAKLLRGIANAYLHSTTYPLDLELFINTDAKGNPRKPPYLTVWTEVQPSVIQNSTAVGSDSLFFNLPPEQAWKERADNKILNLNRILKKVRSFIYVKAKHLPSMPTIIQGTYPADLYFPGKGSTGSSGLYLPVTIDAHQLGS